MGLCRFEDYVFWFVKQCLKFVSVGRKVLLMVLFWCYGIQYLVGVVNGMLFDVVEEMVVELGIGMVKVKLCIVVVDMVVNIVLEQFVFLLMNVGFWGVRGFVF